MYRSLSDALRGQFGRKVYKLSLDAGMTCPNRDGTCGTGGCVFCGAAGGGEFAAKPAPLADQLAAAKARISAKVPADAGYIAYFQSFSNTYAPVSVLGPLYASVLRRPEIVALDVATRPDCLPPDVLDLLERLNREKPVWVELGLQTIHEETARRINRGYPLPVFDRAAAELKRRGLTVIPHMILGLPGETPEMMFATARYLGRSGADGVKFHLLHIPDDAPIAADYRAGRVRVLEEDEYIGLLEECIRLLPPEMVVHRLTGDGDKRHLLAPLWSGDKKRVLNDIHAAFARDGLVQGEHYTRAKETERLTVYDEALRPAGTEIRQVVHEKGLLHEVVHLWIVSRRADGYWLWFQRRAFSKKDFPGLYDLAVGGHVGAGEDYRDSAVREISEEAGLTVRPEQLHYLGITRRTAVHGSFFDREFGRVFLLWDDAPAFRPGPEVAGMIRVRKADWEAHLAGAAEIPAVGLDGKALTVRRDEWAGEAADYAELVEPVL